MWAKKQGAKIKTQKASGVGTKSILRGRGELQARRAKQPEPGGEHRSKLVKNCGGGRVRHSEAPRRREWVWGGGILLCILDSGAGR